MAEATERRGELAVASSGVAGVLSLGDLHAHGQTARRLLDGQA